MCGVVGGEYDQYFIEFVNKRDRETLLQVIKKRIARGSTIMTDKWASYKRLTDFCAELEYAHYTLAHKRTFVEHETGANTQCVEALNSVLKRYLRIVGTNNGDVSEQAKKLKRKE